MTRNHTASSSTRVVNYKLVKAARTSGAPYNIYNIIRDNLYIIINPILPSIVMHAYDPITWGRGRRDLTSRLDFVSRNNEHNNNKPDWIQTSVLHAAHISGAQRADEQL